MGELRDIFVLATVGITMSEALYQWGLATTSPAFAATYEATLPLFTIGLAWFCSQEQLSITVAFNIVCAALGTVFLVQKTPQFSKKPPSLDKHAIPAKHIGHIMLIASYAFKAAFLILLRRFHRRHSQDGREKMGPYCLTLWAYFIAMLQVVLALLTNSQMRQTMDVGLNSGPELIYGMICISAMCPCIITWANMYMSRSTHVAIFACAHPLFVMIMSWMFKGLSPTNPFQLVGALLVVIGLYRNISLKENKVMASKMMLEMGLPTLSAGKSGRKNSQYLKSSPGEKIGGKNNGVGWVETTAVKFSYGDEHPLLASCHNSHNDSFEQQPELAIPAHMAGESNMVDSPDWHAQDNSFSHTSNKTSGDFSNSSFNSNSSAIGGSPDSAADDTIFHWTTYPEPVSPRNIETAEKALRALVHTGYSSVRVGSVGQGALERGNERVRASSHGSDSPSFCPGSTFPSGSPACVGGRVGGAASNRAWHSGGSNDIGGGANRATRRDDQGRVIPGQRRARSWSGSNLGASSSGSDADCSPLQSSKTQAGGDAPPHPVLVSGGSSWGDFDSSSPQNGRSYDVVYTTVGEVDFAPSHTSEGAGSRVDGDDGDDGRMQVGSGSVTDARGSRRPARPSLGTDAKMAPSPFPPLADRVFVGEEAAVGMLRVLPPTFLVLDTTARVEILAHTIPIDGALGDACVHGRPQSALPPTAQCLLQEVLQLKRRYHEQQGHWDIDIGEWGWHEHFGVIRSVAYRCKTHAPVGSQESRMVEIERYSYGDSANVGAAAAAGAAAGAAAAAHGDLTDFRLQAVIFALDAQFGHSFYIETELRINTDERSVSISKLVGVR
jgi:drug/metabolite transporter (DMT)-like permease